METKTMEELEQLLVMAESMERTFRNLNFVNPMCGYDDAEAEYRDAATEIREEIKRRTA